MSIYKPIFEHAISDDDVTHTVKPLLPMTVKWLRSLPDQVRPIALANQYPRIANLLALDWNNPAACRQDLDDLVIDYRRGNRQGFPLDVQLELEILRDYYHSQHPNN
jgi:hypothetical protein